MFASMSHDFGASPQDVSKYWTHETRVCAFDGARWSFRGLAAVDIVTRFGSNSHVRNYGVLRKVI